MPYEGADLLGVFGSREQAVDFIKQQEGYQRSWYNFGVVESELGQLVDWVDIVEWVE